MRFRKIEYIDRETGIKNLNVTKRVEYFLHYWNFIFQNNSGLLLIHQEKFESHRSLLIKLETQIIENKKGYAKRIEPLLLDHSYFQEENLLIKKSPKAIEQIKRFKEQFRNNWFNSGISNHEKNRQLQNEILREFYIIKRSVLLNYLKRLILYLINQLSQDKPFNKRFKPDIHFLINAIIVELYSDGFSIEYIKNIANIIVYPNENQFPFDKTFNDFRDKELFKKYKAQTLKTINLHEQIACLKNLTENKKYPKKNGFCVFKIDDFDFQLEEPITIWGVTFYNPQNKRKVKLNKIFNFIEKDRKSEFESIEIDFNHLIDAKQIKVINSTCNAIIKADYRMFDNDNPVISIPFVIDKVDKALQVLKKLKLDFVNGDGSILGKISTKKCIFLDNEFEYIQFIKIQNDNYSFSLEKAQKVVFKKVLNDINRMYPKKQKLIDLYSYLCQVETDEFSFNFKDFWTVLAEANFANDIDGFIRECQSIFRKQLIDRLFLDTKIFLNNSLFKKSLNLPSSEYLLSKTATRQIGLNIPENMILDVKDFKINYKKLKNYLEIDFVDDIVDELNSFQTSHEEYANTIDEWLKNTIWSAYAERNLETHNNITTDYSLIKLKQDFLFIGRIYFLYHKE